MLVPGNNVILKRLETDAGPRIDEVSELDDDSLLLWITIDNVGVAQSSLSEKDINEIDEYELYVEVIDRSNSTCTLETTLGIQVKLKAVYSKSNKRISSVEVDDINDYNCPYCPY